MVSNTRWDHTYKQSLLSIVTHLTLKLGQPADPVGTFTSVYYTLPSNDYCEISTQSARPDNASQVLFSPTMRLVTGTKHEYANFMGAPPGVEVGTCNKESQDLQVRPLYL